MDECIKKEFDDSLVVAVVQPDTNVNAADIEGNAIAAGIFNDNNTD